MKNHIIEKLSTALILFISLMGCAGNQGVRQSSAEQELPVLTSLQFTENALVIKSNRHFTYTVYKASDPYRATVEIPDMRSGSFTNKIVSNTGSITEVIPRQTESPRVMTTLELVLQSPSEIVPSYKDNTLILAVTKEEAGVVTEAKASGPESVENLPKAVPVSGADEAPAEKMQPAQGSVASMPKATEISSIEVRKSADGVKVLVTGNGTMTPNVFPVSDRIVVDIPETVLRASVPEQAIPPLKGIRAGKHKDKVRLVLDMREKANFDVTATGNVIEISLMGKEPAEPQPATHGEPAGESSAAPGSAAQPQKAPEPEPLTEGVYTGKKISLDFQDADIIPIFRLLGDISGYNIVVHPDVKGKVTLKLINVPWDQALDIVLRTFSLSKLVDGNIIRIVPTAIVTKELDEIARAKKAAAEAGDLKTRIFAINYADLSKMKESIDKAKILSSRGTISVDERGSSIIVNDLDANLLKIESLIRDIDQERMQARQVMIDAKIVEVNSDYLKDLGISWDYFFRTPGANSYSFAGAVDLPAAAAEGLGGVFDFGYISKAGNFRLNMALSAIENTKNGKILSNPRVMTMNNQEAKITNGRTIYVPAATSDKIEFKAIDALLSLTVKPRIAPGGAIFMDLDITKDEPGLPTAGGGGVDILKNTVKTSVLVNDGDTVVIGGVFKKNEQFEEPGIPGLNKLPLIGLLFKKDKETSTMTEGLVFITPRIVHYENLK
jgi:type IV pilus assembly protein PilQ